jgi:serine/threonine protein kinase
MTGGGIWPPGQDAEASGGDQAKTTVDGPILEGAYRIFRIVGEGGMGTVYEGQQLRLNKRVAIKVMSRELAANPEALARFRREAEVTSSIGHPHIVHVFDFGNTPTGEPFMVMEFLDGEDLESRLHRVGRLPPANALAVVKQVASALTATHEQGIVHRDLKPANIYLLNVAGEVDFVKVVDFGISKVRAAITKLTQASVVMGSPQFMSPEQAQGRVEEIDHRTDEWALACIAWEMLCGRCPFTGEDVASLLYQVVHENPPPLAAMVPGLRPEVEEVLRCALAKKREDRFASVGAFARALETAICGSVPSYEPTPPPQPVPFSKDTVSYGSAQTEIAGSLATTRRSADPTLPTLQEKRKLSLTTLSHAVGEVAHRLKIPLPPTKRMLAIAGGSLLVLLFGAFMLFRSGGPAKNNSTAQPVSAPVAAPPSHMTITPTPSLPAAEIPADEQIPKAASTPAKARRPKSPVDPAAAPTDPFQDTKVSPTPRPRPKAQRRIITDI